MTMHSFFPSEDLAIFGDGLAGCLGRHHKGGGRAFPAESGGFDREVWTALADLGAHAAFLPENAGGLGAGGRALMVVMEQLGRAGYASPFLVSNVLGAALLTEGGSDSAALLEGLATGSRIVSVAQGEPGGRYDPARPATSAREVDGGFVLDGQKSGVLWAGVADAIILAAADPGPGCDGQTLFLLPSDTPGLTISDQVTVDGQRAADLLLEGVRLGSGQILGQRHQALAAMTRATDLAILAQAAEAVGQMRSLFAATLDYCRTRRQFDAEISSFQAIQHRLVDMHAACETSSARVRAALSMIDGPASPVSHRDAVLVKLALDEAVRLVGQEAVQLHGGMGMSEELQVGHRFRRLSIMALTFADRSRLLERYAGLETANAGGSI